MTRLGTRGAIALLVLVATLFGRERSGRAEPLAIRPPPDDARTDAILREMPLVGTRHALDDAYAAVRAAPRSPEATHLWVFIGEIERQQGRLERASAAYAAAEEIGGESFWGRHARLGAAETFLAEGRNLEAAAIYRTLVADPDSTIANVAVQRLPQSLRFHLEWILLLIALALLVLFVVLAARLLFRGGLGAARARLVPLPVEISVQAPIYGLLAASCFAIDRPIAPGLSLLAVAEIAIAWIGGAVAPLVRDRRARALAFGLLLLGAAAATLYLFAYLQGLIAIIGETIVNGPEG